MTSARTLRGVRLWSLVGGAGMLLVVILGLAGDGFASDLTWAGGVLLLGASLVANRLLRRHEAASREHGPTD